METVKVNKQELLVIVRKNRETHRTIFLEALEGYRKEIIAILEQRLSEAKSGKRISHRIEMDTPQDYTKEYDKVIKMLEMSVDADIEIDSTTFSCYVMDNWAWKRNFLASNIKYSKTAEEFDENLR